MFVSLNGIRLRTDSGHCLVLGLLTLGSDAGKEVNRKVVVGDDVSTLSVSNVVSSKVVAFVPVLYHFVIDCLVFDPIPRVGVCGFGDRARLAVGNIEPSILPLPGIGLIAEKLMDDV